jgi:hypothetical protein
MSRPGERIGHVQVTAGGNHGLACSLSWPRHHVVTVGVLDPCPQPFVHTGWREQKGKFNFLSKLFLLPTNAHAFKIETLVFQVITLLKGNKTAPFLDSVMDSIRHLGFFFFYEKFPSLKLTLDGLIHSTFSMLINIAKYHQFRWWCNPFFLA